MKRHLLSLTIALGVLCGCHSIKTNSQPGDNALNSTSRDPENLFLEEVLGPQALTWVEKQNKKSLTQFEGDPRFAKIKAQALKILDDPNKMISVSFNDQWAYNFWKDAKAVRGVWRRAPISDYIQGKRDWQVLLDIDALAKDENKNWIFGGASIFKNRALIFLSDGGKDAKVIREFDIEAKTFVADGFNLPEGKNTLSWITEDEVFFGPALSKDQLTQSGYAKNVHLWKRGQAYTQAKLIYSGQDRDIWNGGFVTRDEENGPPRYRLIQRGVDFFHSETFLLENDGRLQKLELPTDAETSLDQDQIYLTLKSDWTYRQVNYKVGSLLKFDLHRFIKGEALIDTVFTPSKTKFLMSSLIDQGRVFLLLSENVSSQVVEAIKGPSTKGFHWHLKKMKLPELSELNFLSFSRKHNTLTISSQGFLSPPTVFKLDLKSGQISQIDQAPTYFDAAPFEVHQHFAISKDGTRIPYFLVSLKGLKLDSKNPTVIDAYGGFEVSMTPHYFPLQELAWLRDGGVFVLANLRGGGEYGPEWHTQAIKENRQRVFDDLFAVSEDLIRRKITSPSHLGAVGRSNGGLLMGVALTQRPDLYKAIGIQVPLLDMMRFHQLLAGASWVGEYGDPENLAERENLLKYSPYQNLRAETKYPEAFIMTSTADDRVHPGHARRFAAKLETLGHPFFYFENTEGGHGGAANNEQIARWVALEYTYFWQKLKR